MQHRHILLHKMVFCETKTSVGVARREQFSPTAIGVSNKHMFTMKLR